MKGLIRTVPILLAALILTGCPDMFVEGMNNPVDPESESYQGYETVSNADDISSNSQRGARWVIFTASEVDGATAYHLQVTTTADAAFVAPIVDNATFSTNVMAPTGNLIANTTYRWRARAQKGGAWGAWPDAATASFAGVEDMDPADGASTTDTTPTLRWDAVTGADRYEVQIADTEAGVADATAATTEANSYTPSTGLTNNATHYWRVRAVDSDGTATAWSRTISLTVSWGVITGMSPADGESTTDTTPTLSWDAVDGADRYEVQIASTAAGVVGATAATTEANSYTPPTGLTNNATHYWRVRAVDSDGTATAWSRTISFTVSWGVITGMSPADGSSTTDTTPTLSWDAVTGADHYEVQIASTEAGVPGAMPVTVNAPARSYTWPTALSDGDTLYWRVKAVDDAGSEGAWSSIASLAIRVYVIGDTGPAGGIVFYDKGSYSSGWRYLEAAPSDIEVSGDFTHVWGGRGTSVGGTGTAVGTGAANTTAIVAKYGTSDPYHNTGNYAARLCDLYTYGGYSDWFLPSKDELNLMYQNKGTIGGFASSNYWRSSEYDSNSAWDQYFPSGFQYNYYKIGSSTSSGVPGFLAIYLFDYFCPAAIAAGPTFREGLWRCTMICRSIRTRTG